MQDVLEKTLFHFDRAKKEPFKVSDAVRGVQIFGGIGSGKTSGSGKWIAKSFLIGGFGGIVLCGKPDEAQTWIEYADELGRTDDIIHFNESSNYYFNPLEYERSRTDEGGGLTFNLTNLFLNLYKLGQRIGGSDSKEGQRFWESALKRCLNRVIDLIKMSGEELSVDNMVQIVTTIPNAEEIIVIKKFKKIAQIKKYGETNFCMKCVFLADQFVGSKIDEIDNDNSLDDIAKEKAKIKLRRDLRLITSYFIEEFPNLYPEGRTIIQEMFLGLAEPFTSGLLADHFADGLHMKLVVPEDTFEGKIIILDFPVKKYLEAGIYAQSIFKLIWQQTTERREVNKSTLPVFLWVDESQYFVNEYDMLFQTTARSSRACTVFLSQNISNYYAALSGENSRAKVDSLLGNLSTKIFHANNDSVTNEWAANTIAQDFMNVQSINNIGSDKTSSGLQQQLAWQVQPREFTELKCGGKEHSSVVEGIVTTTSRVWGIERKNFAKWDFNQNV